MKKERWTAKEDEILVKYYGKISIREINKIYLQNRTRNAIKARAINMKLNGNHFLLNSIYHTKYQIKNDKRICSVCKIEKPISEFNRKESRLGGYAPRCKKCTKKYLEKWLNENPAQIQNRRKSSKNCRLKIRQIVLDHYGNRCSCPKCPETNPLFLSIEHLNGHGKKHRKERGDYGVYRDIIDSGFPSNITLLCFNCNFAKYHNGGICPHLH